MKISVNIEVWEQVTNVNNHSLSYRNGVTVEEKGERISSTAVHAMMDLTDLYLTQVTAIIEKN